MESTRLPSGNRSTETKCLAVDLGAGSGRVVLGDVGEAGLRLQEVGRFATPMRTDAETGYQCWDLEAIISEIERNIMQARLSSSVTSVGVDSWGVDYVLLDEHLNRVGVPVCYRDKRTAGVMEELCVRLSRQEIYERTGIQFLTFNTIYQLAACGAQHPEWLEKAAHFLMIPDYLHFRLCGAVSNEYTNATTTQLCGLDGDWDRFLMRSIGLKESLMKSPVAAGTVLGDGTGEARGLKVVAPATHDTGSAIAGTPLAGPDDAYISSGTWSLMGIESTAPIANEDAMRMNFTNEGGVERRFRVLKNIMGMWPIQRLCEEQNVRDVGPVVKRAAQEQPWRAIINVNDSEFLNPQSMTDSIRERCRRSGQPVPQTMAQLARCVFDSLALSYRMVKEQLELLRGRKLARIRIVGGGSRNTLLNQLCADACEIAVTAGPVEASVLGNLSVQMIAMGAIENLSAGRELIGRSFELQEYCPQKAIPVDVIERFEQLIAMDGTRGQTCA